MSVLPARLAAIDAEACIGCMLCVPACPTDAIAGEAKQVHRVVTAACTGCGLCVPVCPADCIGMVTAREAVPAFAAPELPAGLREKIETARAKVRAKHFRF